MEKVEAAQPNTLLQTTSRFVKDLQSYRSELSTEIERVRYDRRKLAEKEKEYAIQIRAIDAALSSIADIETQPKLQHGKIYEAGGEL